MAGSGSKSAKTSNVSTVRKRVEAQVASLKRARDGSAFVRCEECNKDVAAALIGMHNCSSEAKLKTNLEALVVESQTEAIKKKPSAPRKERKPRDPKKSKDLNKPKRHTTAFFVFMEDFRKTYKEEHPDNKSVAVVAKEGGEKWKSLTDEERKVYVDRAAERKAEYEKNLKEQNDDEEDNEGDSPDEEGEKEEVKADEEGEDEEVKDEAVCDDE